jgi:hypothetical protein
VNDFEPSAESRLPLGRSLLLSVAVGVVYFVPQGLHVAGGRPPRLLLEENLDETFLAVLVSRAAGEHPGQPDPYRVAPAEEGAAFYDLQRFPLIALGGLAHLLSVRANSVLWLGAFVFPAVIAWLVAALGWRCGLRRWPLLALLAAMSLLALPPPYWWTQAKYTATVIAGGIPESRLMLPFSRRYQPQFVALPHFAAVLLWVTAVLARSPRVERAAAWGAGLAFGITFYSYLYSGTILLGFFALGGGCVWIWHRERLRSWILAGGTGLLFSVPFWWWAIRHFATLSAATGTARSHRLSAAEAPELLFELVIAAGCAYGLRRRVRPPALLWVPLALVLSALLGAVQHVVTGVAIQPYHYTQYFGRPAVSFGVVALTAAALERWPPLCRRAGWLIPASAGLVALLTASALVIQWRRFRIGSEIASRVEQAWPVLEVLRRRMPAGELAFAPDPDVREAIPLYTNAAPYTSMYLWMANGQAWQEAVLSRFASAYALAGSSPAAFQNLVRSRPWDMFLLHRQRPGPEADAEMQQMEQVLLREFDRVLQGGLPAASERLRYLLLPASMSLGSTRFASFFVCRPIWEDRHYRLYQLAAPRVR